MIVLLLLFSSSVMSNSLRPHGLQHSRFSCPSLSPEVCWNSCPVFFLPSFTSLIPLFIHFLRCFYFNILLKSVIGVRCLCLLSSCKDVSHIVLVPTLMISFYINYSFKDPFSKHSHTWSSWGLGLQHENMRDGQNSSHYSL